MRRGTAARQSSSALPPSPRPGPSWAVVKRHGGIQRGVAAEQLQAEPRYVGTFEDGVEPQGDFASCAAMGFKSTPNTLVSAMYIFTRCFSCA